MIITANLKSSLREKKEKKIRQDMWFQLFLKREYLKEICEVLTSIKLGMGMMAACYIIFSSFLMFGIAHNLTTKIISYLQLDKPKYNSRKIQNFPPCKFPPFLLDQPRPQLNLTFFLGYFNTTEHCCRTPRNSQFQNKFTLTKNCLLSNLFFPSSLINQCHVTRLGYPEPFLLCANLNTLISFPLKNLLTFPKLLNFKGALGGKHLQLTLPGVVVYFGINKNEVMEKFSMSFDST